VSVPDGQLLVLGIGNILLRDEGAGVLVIRELEARVAAGDLRLAEDVRLLDGGTLGLDLLPIISDARALVIVDAVDFRADPGSVRVIRGADIVAALEGHVSPHQVGVGDLVATARLLGTLPAEVALVGIQARDIAIGLDPSPSVLAGIPVAVDAVLAEIARFGSGRPAGDRSVQAVSTPSDGLNGTRSVAATVVPSR
jgi:hydrogenase maturation protease